MPAEVNLVCVTLRHRIPGGGDVDDRVAVEHGRPVGSPAFQVAQ